jgi:hypothetical protein
LTVLEIVRRGARRVPPANSKGEELRDVIHWLAVLSYAKQGDSKILFVSRDSGFWRKDGGPREEILQDIKDAGLRIEIFRDIEDLLKQNSLSSTPLEPGRAMELFDVSKVEARIVEVAGKLLDSLEVGDSVTRYRSGRLVSSEFWKGTVYQVDAGSEFIEATFRIKVSCEIEFRPRFTAWGEGLGRTLSLSSLAGERTSPIDSVVLVDLSARVIDLQAGEPEVERVSWDTSGNTHAAPQTAKE